VKENASFAAELALELRAIICADSSRIERARRAAEAVRRARDFHWVGLYDVTAEFITAGAWTGTIAPAYPTFPRAQGLNGEAVRTCTAIIANDVSADPRYSTTFAATGAEMVVPVLDEAGTVVGTIDVESPRLGAFGVVERRFVVEVAQVLIPLWAER
jgi:L-methionine (R)-S-oxide reductase